MYNENEDKYYIRLDSGERVEVTKEVRDVYYKMRDRERYLERRDQKQGLLHYEDWSHDRINGEELLPDERWNPEKRAMEQLHPSLWDYISMLHDEYHIFYFVSLGLNDREIAQILGLSRSGISKQKRRLFRQLREILVREGFLEK